MMTARRGPLRIAKRLPGVLRSRSSSTGGTSWVVHEKVGVGDSGEFVERDLFHVWTLRDGMIVKWRVFETREQALEAAGLRE